MNFSLPSRGNETAFVLSHLFLRLCRKGWKLAAVGSPLAMVSIPASSLESESKGTVGFSPLPSIPCGTFPALWTRQENLIFQ